MEGGWRSNKAFADRGQGREAEEHGGVKEIQSGWDTSGKEEIGM